MTGNRGFMRLDRLSEALVSLMGKGLSMRTSFTAALNRVKALDNPNCDTVRNILLPLFPADNVVDHEWEADFTALCGEIRSLGEDSLALAFELYHVDAWDDAVLAAFATKDEFMLYCGGPDSGTGTERSLNIDSVAEFLRDHEMTVDELIAGFSELAIPCRPRSLG
jgi:hypothetical protein